MRSNEALEDRDTGTQDGATVKDSFDKVIKEFGDLTAAFNDLVAAGSPNSEKLGEMRDQALAKVDEAKEIASQMSRNALQQTRYAAVRAGDYVRENPLRSAAIAAGLGIVAGMLIHRDRR